MTQPKTNGNGRKTAAPAPTAEAENGSPIEGELDNVRYFHERGIRYITLAHSLSNHISDSSYDENRQWSGLSEFGAEVVAEMNRVGIMVDVSHLSDDAFWDVMDISEVPVIASHSSARHFTPDFERNMSDEMIKRLGENGGVIHINFGSGFLTKKARDYDKVRWPAIRAWLEAGGALSPHNDANLDWYGDEIERSIAYVAARHDHTLETVAVSGGLAGSPASVGAASTGFVGDARPHALGGLV